MADISGAFEVDGLVKQREELERLLMSNPEMEKKVQGLIRKVLHARKVISGDICDQDKERPAPGIQGGEVGSLSPHPWR